MGRIKSRTTWLDANGTEHEISEMADDHIVNCILLCRRKVKSLESVNEDNLFAKQIKEWSSYIPFFKAELTRRKEVGLVIEREKDSYFHYVADWHEYD